MGDGATSGVILITGAGTDAGTDAGTETSGDAADLSNPEEEFDLLSPRPSGSTAFCL